MLQFQFRHSLNQEHTLHFTPTYFKGYTDTLLNARWRYNVHITFMHPLYYFNIKKTFKFKLPSTLMDEYILAYVHLRSLLN